MKKLFLLLALAGLFATACGENNIDDHIDNPTEKPDEDKDNPVFEIDPEGNITIEADGGTIVVKVTTNLEYDVIIPDDASSWLSIADTRAVREETLTFNVAKNEDNEERTAVVNLCAEDDEILQTITIRQDKSSAITCANNEIIYTTKYGYPIELKITDGFGGNLMSHTYEDGYGKIVFDNDVVILPEGAFMDCDTLTSIVLPGSITEIEDYVFYGCSNLVKFQGELASEDGRCVIMNGTLAIFAPSGLTEYTIPDGVTTIGKGAFEDCDSLTSVTIPDSVTTIGGSAFSGCISLTSVTIPDSVTTIGEGAFYSCDSLTSVTIGNSVTEINWSVFYDCSSLTSVYCKPTTPPILRGSYVFDGNASERKIYVPFESVNIYKSAECWSVYADDIIGYDFETREIVAEHKLVYTATSQVYPKNSGFGAANILYNNFDVATGVGIIGFDLEVVMIGERTFYECDSLTGVTIPDSVTTIGDYAFSHCTSLTSVTIGDGVTTIGEAAFSSCDSLTSVTIPDSVTTIGDYAFSHCTSLTSVNIPDSVTIVGDYAFSSCDSLTSVTIGDGVTTIGRNAFGWCSSLMAFYGAFASDDNKSLIVDGVLNSFAPSGVTQYAIPDSVTTIGEDAFNSCTSLTSVTIPDSVTKIGDSAFANCSSLISVTIGNSVTEIKGTVFYGCSSLTTIYGKYASDDNRCLIIDGVLEIFVPAGLTQYTIPDSVTTIGDFAFYGCISLTSVTIPDSVTTIGNSAFNECDSLTSVTIPDSVTTIGDCALANCSSLKSVTIGNSVKMIGVMAFCNCESLASVTIGDSVTTIGNDGFYGCIRLTSVTIPDSVTTIGDGAFYCCISLTSVTIGNSVTEIDGSVFYGCSSLTSVYCKPTTPPILRGSYVFDGNASGRRIYVPASDDNSIINAYKTAEYWSEYADAIVEYKF